MSRTEEAMKAYEHLSLHISREVRDLLENRKILREDLQRTIHQAETTGEKFVNFFTGRSLAFLRPDRVTYWVEYRKIDEIYLIYSAYCHRMEMKRGQGL